MPLPYSLSTTISGLSVWAYDFNRNPTNDDKTTSVGTASNGDYILPVSKTFVKYDTNVHMIRMVCDENHVFPAKGTLMASGSYPTTSNAAYASLPLTSDYQTWSQIYWSNLRVVQNVVVSGIVLNSAKRTPFTTTSKDVTIATQTGITTSSSDYAYVVFTIADNASIPANSTITVNGKEENPYTGDSSIVSMPPIKYTIPYDMQAGSYIMRIAGDPAFISASIDFPTVQTVPTTPKHTIIWNLSNCSVTPSDTIVDQGTHTWTFKADNGYYFDKTGGVYNVNFDDYGSEIPATGTDTTTLTYDLEHDIKVGLVASKLQGTTIPIKQTLTNATSNVSGAEVDRKINQIIISAISGYQFKDDILVQLYTGSTVTQSFSVAGIGGTTVNLPFNTNTQNTITDTMTNIIITAVAVKPETSTGYAHYYAISKTELSQFSKQHIWTMDSASNVGSYDVSKYIDNLIELPFKYDTTELPTSTIAVGRVTTASTTHELKERFYILDFGKINVPAKYKNGYDYQIRECKIYLPFAPAVSIAIDNVMEQTIHIVYKIDMSTGNATITLDNNGVPFNTLNINLADTMPFLNTLKNTVIKDGQHQIYNGIRNPYLVITRNQPILDSDFYPTREQNNISNYQGRLKATLLDDTGITDYDDLNELENLLANGVIYNSQTK